MGLHAGDPEGPNGEQLAMHPRLCQTLMTEQNLRDGDQAPTDSFTGRARRFLMDQLRAATPQSQFERGLIELKLAYHRAHLDREQADELLKRFRGTAHENELRQMLGEGLALQGTAGPALATWSPGQMAAMRDFRAPSRTLALGALVERGGAMAPLCRGRGSGAGSSGRQHRGLARAPYHSSPQWGPSPGRYLARRRGGHRAARRRRGPRARGGGQRSRPGHRTRRRPGRHRNGHRGAAAGSTASNARARGGPRRRARGHGNRNAGVEPPFDPESRAGRCRRSRRRPPGH